MRPVSAWLLLTTALALAGCSYTAEHRAMTGGGSIGDTRALPPRPAYYIAPPPGVRRCMVWGEDMYGRRFCDRYYGP